MKLAPNTLFSSLYAPAGRLLASPSRIPMFQGEHDHTTCSGHDHHHDHHDHVHVHGEHCNHSHDHHDTHGKEKIGLWEKLKNFPKSTVLWFKELFQSMMTDIKALLDRFRKKPDPV